ncbi:hypothetical protein [Halodesulfovibrio sp.]|jgi:hypothetical protein|uniref:hypothetical protein n=1 Tax=Halodesulfovibrio sp. TaxID=1912772 RepID=UPI0025E22D9C|nr:hypothetical protein [Halodesulfovibrio sp.]MCT4627318.1 hypothetical protein [Halodesulfovibrio sp.]
MKEQRPLLPLFGLLVLTIVTFVVTLVFFQFKWLVLFHFVSLTIIVATTYYKEKREHALNLVHLSSIVAGIISFGVFLWSAACFLFELETLSTAAKWQTMGTLAASGITGMAAFATFGSLLRMFQTKKESKDNE